MSGPAIRHRLTAILAADAAGYSRLMAQDEQATVSALDAARAVFKTQIEAHQGRVIDMAGDSVLAVFETATGAVNAALAIQAALKLAAAEVERDRRMQFRIGVHLGDVIEKLDGTVYGDGVNVAARLEGLAAPGGITVSDAIRGVVSGRVDATFTDQGAQRLKNIARPVRAFALNHEGAAADAGQAAVAPIDPAPATPQRMRRSTDDGQAGSAATPRPAQRPLGLFVGRQQEMATLKQALDQVRSGQGQVAMLAGSGGMGKTRLTQELAVLAEPQGVNVLWGRCLEEPGAPPYWPWRQLIRGYLRSSQDPDPGQALGQGLSDIAGIVPELAEHIGAPTAAANAGDSAQSRFRLFDAVAGFWRRAAQRSPLLLIFEDLHWADATSLRLFAFLAAEILDSRLLMLGTYRDTELSRQHPLFDTLGELARSPAYRRIELAGLSSRETEEFTSAAGGGTASARFASALHARTEGHPLFLEETLRFMLEGRAVPTGSIGDDPRALLAIPTGVREVIGKRLNRLSVSTGSLLAVAACIGRSFDLDLLAQLQADKSEDEVLIALEEALGAHLIESVSETHGFRFSHALIRETLYDEMLGLRRSRLHLRIGELLEQHRGHDDSKLLPQLAYHFSEAGPGAAALKALDYARQSAAQATGVLAFEEASRLYRLALQLQQKHVAQDAALRCQLLLALGEAELSMGAGEPAREVFAQAAELARKHGLVEPFARAAVGFERTDVLASRSGEQAVVMLLEAAALHQAADPLRVELLAGLCRAYVYCDRADEAKEANRRAVALARQIDDMRGLYLAQAAIVSANYWPNMLHERLAAANEAWAIAADPSLSLSLVELLPFFVADLIHVGDMPTLRRVLDHGMRIAEQAHSPYMLTLCRHTEALLAINEGRFADAEAWASRALESGRHIAEDLAQGAYGMQMFCLRREQGRLHETLPLLQHFVRTTPSAQAWQPGLALLYAELEMRAECQAEFDALPWAQISAAPRDVSSMTTLMFAAEVCAYLGDSARAEILYTVLQPQAGTNLLSDFGGPCLGSSDRLLGKLASVMERWDVAQAHFEAALALDKRTGWRVWLAHSRTAYAAMLHRRAQPGDDDRARTLLAEALAESSALEMNVLRPRIKALVDAIVAPPPAYPCGLTEREVGVLRLLAMGRNNREIGQVLAISPNTVANHVRSILEKTYTANRTEAAAFANREGLVEP